MPTSSSVTRTQPVHVVYGGAHLFKATTCTKLGDLARRAAEEHDVVRSLHLDEEVAKKLGAKLDREPIEDYRVDFEDGYGVRSDAEEDAAAANVAREMANAALPRYFGIRVKPGARGLHTLRLFLDNAASLPPNFVVTLPKVSKPEQVQSLLKALPKDVEIELLIETPAAVRDMRTLVEAAEGRCRGAHLGAYDYLASLGVSQQDLLHPACDFARSKMLLDLAGTGVWLSDGATNTLPVKGADIEAAWQLHYNNTRRALYNGFYQGWDLHPAQIPARLAAVFTFFLEGLPAAEARLKNFETMQQQATQVGGEFDDAATILVLRNFIARAVSCGAADAV